MIIKCALYFPASLMFFYAVNFLPVGITQTIFNLTPFFTVILSYIFLEEKVSFKNLVVMKIAFMGAFIVIFFSSKQSNTEESQTYQFVIAVIFIIIATII